MNPTKKMVNSMETLDRLERNTDSEVPFLFYGTNDMEPLGKTSSETRSIA